MSLISNTGILTISATALPSYVSSTVGDFTQIPTSNISFKDPSPPITAGAGGSPYSGPASKINAWTSFCVDQRTAIVYSMLQGGHNDYMGNECNRFQLLLPGAQWEEPVPSTPSAQIPANGQVRNYGDGKPCDFHTYFGQWFFENEGANGRAMQFAGAWFDPNSGGWSGQVEAYDVATNAYLLNGSGGYPDVPSAVPGPGIPVPAPAMARDTRNSNLYMFGNFNVCRYNVAAKTATMLSGIVGTVAYGYGVSSAFDSALNRILLLGGDDPSARQQKVYYVDTNTFQPATLTGAAATAVSTQGEGGMQYVPSQNAFFMRTAAAGGTVYKITPTGANTFDCTVYATSNGGGIPGIAHGPYNKWLYVSLLKSIVYFPSHTGNGWCLRIEP